MLAMLDAHGIKQDDIESYDVTKKAIDLSKPAADGTTQTTKMARHFRVQVRDLSQWADIITALMAGERSTPSARRSIAATASRSTRS